MCPKCVQNTSKCLDIIWTKFGQIMDTSPGEKTGPSFAKRACKYPKFGHILDTIWTHFGHTMDTF